MGSTIDCARTTAVVEPIRYCFAANGCHCSVFYMLRKRLPSEIFLPAVSSYPLATPNSQPPKEECLQATINQKRKKIVKA
jgi:hypothetical protein